MGVAVLEQMRALLGVDLFANITAVRRDLHIRFMKPWRMISITDLPTVLYNMDSTTLPPYVKEEAFQQYRQ